MFKQGTPNPEKPALAGTELAQMSLDENPCCGKVHLMI